MFDDPQTQAAKATADVIAAVKQHIVGQQLIEAKLDPSGVALYFGNGTALWFVGRIAVAVGLPHSEQPDGPPN